MSTPGPRVVAGDLRGRSARPRRRCTQISAWALCASLAAGCASTSAARAVRAMDEGAYAAAADAYREALRGSPQDVDLWIGLGRAELALGHGAAARHALTSAASRRPGSARVRIWIGYSYELDRNYREAQLAYEQAVRMAPREARPARVLGTRLLAWGEAGAAIAPLRRSLELEPGHAETWNALALAEHHAGDTARAEAAFRRGLALHPGHMGLRLGLAALLINDKRYAQALAVYDALARERPRFAAVQVGRALLLDTMGRRAEALAAFERASALSGHRGPYRERFERYRASLGGPAASTPGGGSQ